MADIVFVAHSVASIIVSLYVADAARKTVVVCRVLVGTLDVLLHLELVLIGFLTRDYD